MHTLVPPPFSIPVLSRIRTPLIPPNRNTDAINTTSDPPNDSPTVQPTSEVTQPNTITDLSTWKLQAFPNRTASPAVDRPTFDIVVSCLCLGIPVILSNREQPHSVSEDPESGSHSRTGPMPMIGACGPFLVAVVILNASVSLLYLPGFDELAQVAAFIAIVLATISMGSALVAILRYSRAGSNAQVSSIDGEGQMMLSRQNMISSFPFVFLTYSVLAFFAAILRRNGCLPTETTTSSSG